MSFPIGTEVVVIAPPAGKYSSEMPVGAVGIADVSAGPADGGLMQFVIYSSPERVKGRRYGTYVHCLKNAVDTLFSETT